MNIAEYAVFGVCDGEFGSDASTAKIEEFHFGCDDGGKGDSKFA